MSFQQPHPRCPDYRGGSLFNLMASLIRALGGQSDDPELRLLPAASLTGARHLILLVIDGLGDDWLRRHSPDGILARHRLGGIDSVFPATTAAAIPCFLTGDPPLRHGLTGWHTYLGELGGVMSVLPGKPRHGGVSYRQAGIDPRRLFDRLSVFERIQAPSTLVSPRWIARSDFNLAHAGPARILDFETLDELFQRTARALQPRRHEAFWPAWRPGGQRRTKPAWSGPDYSYLYWPALDSIGHARGMESPEAVAHLREIEQALERFMRAIADTDSLLLVTADHGQIDTTAADRIDLADHPALEDCLALPLCGEPRAAFCYVRPDRSERFERYCREILGDQVELWPSRQLWELGLFGPGTPHPRFRERIGDWCLLPRGNRIVRQWLPFDERHVHIGVHGGLSAAELEVPLCRLASG